MASGREARFGGASIWPTIAYFLFPPCECWPPSAASPDSTLILSICSHRHQVEALIHPICMSEGPDRHTQQVHHRRGSPRNQDSVISVKASCPHSLLDQKLEARSYDFHLSSDFLNLRDRDFNPPSEHFNATQQAGNAAQLVFPNMVQPSLSVLDS